VALTSYPTVRVLAEGSAKWGGTKLVGILAGAVLDAKVGAGLATALRTGSVVKWSPPAVTSKIPAVRTVS
jgi:hypothetical protein